MPRGGPSAAGLTAHPAYVYFGVLAGLGGPFVMIRTHDLRDWAQRQPRCHDYFAHRRPPLIDAWWQMHCELRLAHAPDLRIEDEIANDPFYRFIDRHWITVHLPWALVFWLIGGWAWVVWGVCAQIAVTVTGHWLIGWFAHQPHEDDWQVRGAGVQGRNVPLTGLEAAGLAWNIRLPEDLAWRPQLHWSGADRPVRQPDRKPCRVMTLLGRLCGLRA